MRKAMLLALLALGAIASSASAQEMKGMNHEVTVISGAVRPDAIPDSVAYHNVFIHLADQLKDEKTAGHAMYSIQRIGMSVQGMNVLISTLEAYGKSHYAGVARQPKDFVPERNTNVTNTRNYLAAHLSSDDMAFFDRYVRLEKAHMTITVVGGKQ